MSKLEQAARQALEAMQNVHGDYHLMPGRIGPKEAFEMMREAITALRDALAVSEQRTKEQALQKLSDFHQSIEQEPVTVPANGLLVQEPSRDTPTGSQSDMILTQPFAYYCDELNINGELVDREYNGINQFSGGRFGKPLYAAPVRTKDLTDTELMDCRSSDPAGGSWLESARAVIAKFKEKNK